MTPKKFMLISGEASGDQLAAELVTALQARLPGSQFFGAGGHQMKAAGVDILYDMSRLAIVGATDVLRNVFEIKRVQRQMLAAAIARKPDVFIGVDYGGFNLRFGQAIKQYLRDNPFVDWHPKVVQFISPQVWASRPKRADRMAGDYDLLLSIFPFEKAWYTKRVPSLRVEFVGHPMVERFQQLEIAPRRPPISPTAPNLLLLPGSRRSELKQHLPVMLAGLKLIREKIPGTQASMVVPNQNIAALAKAGGADMPIQIGDLPAALARADLALAKTGTVTMECAFMRMPAVTFYKGSWLNYQIVRHFVTVKYFTTANLLADDEVYPEFLQYNLTPENLARATLEILQNESRRAKLHRQLDEIIASLGGPGATGRAADAILSLWP